MKKIVLSLLLITVFTLNTKAQTLIEITPPVGFKYQGMPVTIGTNLYLRYLGADNNYDLFKYDGTTFTEIPSPVGYTGAGKGYTGHPIVVGNDLYMRYKGDDNNFDLFKYDGTTLTEISSPAGFTGAGNGYIESSVIVGSDLYMWFKGDDNNYDLFKYDGTTLTEIPSPVGYTGAGNGYQGLSIAIGSDLYLRYTADDGNMDLFKYDGTTLTQISSPAGFTGSGYGYSGSPIVIGTDLFLRYHKDDDSNVLVKYDGTTLTEIPSLAGYTGALKGYTGGPIAIGTDLYLRYVGDDDNYDLFKYDGTILTEISSPAGFTNAFAGYNTSLNIVVGTVLYMRYLADDNNYVLFKYDGTTLTEIPSPIGFTGSSKGYYGRPIIFGSDLLMQYVGDDGNADLFKYDGTILTEISSPTGFAGSGVGYTNYPIIVGTELYLQYVGDDTNYDLFKYDGTTLTEISSPAGFTNAGVGYSDSPIVVGTDLYLRYFGNDYGYDLFKLGPACTNSSSTFSASACESYTSPSGKIWTASNTYLDTIPNTEGCDSLITINLTVNPLPTVTYTALANICIDGGLQAGLGGGIPTGGIYSGAGVTDDGNGTSYTFDPTAASVGTHTLTYSYTDGNNCSANTNDDVEVFALPTVTYTALANICASSGLQAGLGGGTPTGGVYSGAGVTDDGNGTSYTFDPVAAGAGTHTLTYSFTDGNSCSANASDDVEVYPLLNGIHNETVCFGGSIIVNGVTYDAGNLSGTEVFTNVGPNGCDSSLAVTLTILPELIGNVTSTLCFGDSIVINGTTYNENKLTGTEVFTGIGINNCDSTVTVNISVENAINTITTVSGVTITSAATGVTYQWLDCDNGDISITGETDANFTPTIDGNYAVALTSGSCTDTSDCVNIAGVGINETTFGEAISVYPNPTNGAATIYLGAIKDATITVLTITGKELYKVIQADKNTIDLTLTNFSNGIYFLKIQKNNQQKVIKLIKK